MSEKEVFVLQAIKIWVPVNLALPLVPPDAINASYIYLTALCVLSFLGPFMSASEVLVGPGPAACCFSWLFLVSVFLWGL